MADYQGSVTRPVKELTCDPASDLRMLLDIKHTALEETMPDTCTYRLVSNPTRWKSVWLLCAFYYN